jgi:hypothetical protein
LENQVQIAMTLMGSAARRLALSIETRCELLSASR